MWLVQIDDEVLELELGQVLRQRTLTARFEVILAELVIREKHLVLTHSKREQNEWYVLRIETG